MNKNNKNNENKTAIENAEKMTAHAINRVEIRKSKNDGDKSIIFARDAEGWKTLAQFNLTIFAIYEGEKVTNETRIDLPCVMRLCGLSVPASVVASANNAKRELEKDSNARENARIEKYTEIINGGEKKYIRKVTKNGRARFANMQKYITEHASK